jgi:hypothetical protein
LPYHLITRIDGETSISEAFLAEWMGWKGM